MAETTESPTGSRAMDDEIKPWGWMLEWGTDWDQLHRSDQDGPLPTEWEDDDSPVAVALYTQDQLDAAVAKERERWIAGLEALHRDARDRHNYYLFAAEMLKEPAHG